MAATEVVSENTTPLRTATVSLTLNTLREDGFLPYLLSGFFYRGEREGEQAVIHQQPASLLALEAVDFAL